MEVKTMPLSKNIKVVWITNLFLVNPFAKICFEYIWIKNALWFCKGRANGLRYLRWGGDGEAVQPEKW